MALHSQTSLCGTITSQNVLKRKSRINKHRCASGHTPKGCTHSKKGALSAWPYSISHYQYNEGLFKNSTKLEAVLRVPQPGRLMQSQGNTIRDKGDTEDRTSRLLSQHEIDQELLYILWRDNRVINCIALWSKALSDLQKEAPCEYFAWLMKRNPPLVY